MVLLAVIGYLTAQGRNVFEESGQSSVVRVRVELVRGMRDMVVDVMEQNSVGGAARGRDQLRGSWTSTASVPLRAWRRSLTAFVMGRSKFRERVERQHARWRLWKGYEP